MLSYNTDYQCVITIIGGLEDSCRTAKAAFKDSAPTLKAEKSSVELTFFLQLFQKILILPFNMQLIW